LNNTEAFHFFRVQGKDLLEGAGPAADHMGNFEGKKRIIVIVSKKRLQWAQ
jgi:hypothetical protein